MGHEVKSEFWLCLNVVEKVVVVEIFVAYDVRVAAARGENDT